eukprot:PhF_6_TR34984/c0_g2_i1/m.50826
MGQSISFGARGVPRPSIVYQFIVSDSRSSRNQQSQLHHETVCPSGQKELFDTPEISSSFVPVSSGGGGHMFPQTWQSHPQMQFNVVNNNVPVENVNVDAIVSQQEAPFGEEMCLSKPSSNFTLKPRVLFGEDYTPSTNGSGAMSKLDHQQQPFQVGVEGEDVAVVENERSPNIELPSQEHDNEDVSFPAFSPSHNKTLKPHQKRGVEFLWKNVVQQGSGAVLAHSMGIGKTLTVITFLQLMCTTRITKCIVLAPKSVLCTWKEEMEQWGQHMQSHPFHFVICEEKAIRTNAKQPSSATAEAMKRWDNTAESTVLAMSHHLYCAIYNTCHASEDDNHTKGGKRPAKRGADAEDGRESRNVLLA